MAKIEATFSLWSALPISELTDALKMVPDKTVARGRDRIPPRGLPLENGWHITCCDESEKDAEKTLAKLFRRIEPVLPRIERMRAIDNSAHVKFAILISPYDDGISLFFSERTVKLISSFSGSIDIAFCTLLIDD